MVVQEITWAKGDPAYKDNDTFFLQNPNTNHKLGTTFLYLKKYTNNKRQSLLLRACHMTSSQCGCLKLNLKTEHVFVQVPK
jgi:hypothetical protein